MAAGRNDPCPCGSGRKYKKCHLAADEERAEAEGAARAAQAAPAVETGRAGEGDVPPELVELLLDPKVGPAAMEVFRALVEDPERATELGEHLAKLALAGGPLAELRFPPEEFARALERHLGEEPPDDDALDEVVARCAGELGTPEIRAAFRVRLLRFARRAKARRDREAAALGLVCLGVTGTPDLAAGAVAPLLEIVLRVQLGAAAERRESIDRMLRTVLGASLDELEGASIDDVARRVEDRGDRLLAALDSDPAVAAFVETESDRLLRRAQELARSPAAPAVFRIDELLAIHMATVEVAAVHGGALPRGRSARQAFGRELGTRMQAVLDEALVEGVATRLLGRSRAPGLPDADRDDLVTLALGVRGSPVGIALASLSRNLEADWRDDAERDAAAAILESEDWAPGQFDVLAAHLEGRGEAEAARRVRSASEVLARATSRESPPSQRARVRDAATKTIDAHSATLEKLSK